MSDFLKSWKAVAAASVAGLLIVLQFTILAAALDFITSILLVAVGFVAGRSSK